MYTPTPTIEVACYTMTELQQCERRLKRRVMSLNAMLAEMQLDDNLSAQVEEVYENNAAQAQCDLDHVQGEMGKREDFWKRAKK